MAVFHVLSSAREGATHTEFTVRFVHGGLVVGDEFCCYDTHHPVKYLVLRAEEHGETATLHCDGWLGYDDQFTGAVLDTERTGRPAGFHYPPPAPARV